MSKKMFAKGKINHNGVVYFRQEVTISDDPAAKDSIDQRSATRLEAMGYLVKAGSPEAQAITDAQQAEADKAASIAAGASDPLAGAHTTLPAGAGMPQGDATGTVAPQSDPAGRKGR